jgi:F-type H+-transporting ATPase subunit b
MQIDWLTVSAQIVNFLVLAWLLHRFLYGPITRAMERREQRIAQRLNDAQRMQEEAEEEARTFRADQKALDDQREQILSKARQDADMERDRLFDEARREVADQKRRWLDDLAQQRDTFVRDIRQHARANFFALARRALGDLADADLQDRMSRIFQEKLATLDEEARGRLAAAGRDTSNAAIVRSGLDLAPETQRRITRTVQDEILADALVKFERKPDLICGLELKMGGQTVAWNFDRYLETLERQTAEEIDTLPRPSD